MLSTFKKAAAAFFAAALSLCSLGAAGDMSMFSALYYNANFFSNADVLNAYAGVWSGSQIVEFGDVAARGNVEITYTPEPSENGVRLVGVGRIASASGASVPTSSYMYQQGGTLILEMRTNSGARSFYKGVIDARSVIWLPIYDFFAYDFQQDFFYTENGKTFIQSNGAREFSYGGKTGVLRISTKYERVESAYPFERVKSSLKKNINVEAVGGVKFGD